MGRRLIARIEDMAAGRFLALYDAETGEVLDGQMHVAMERGTDSAGTITVTFSLASVVLIPSAPEG